MNIHPGLVPIIMNSVPYESDLLGIIVIKNYTYL